MTQSSNTSISKTDYKNEYKGEEFSFKFQSKPLNIYLQADSNNNIFKAKFSSSHGELKSSLDTLCQYSLDKNLDDLLLSLAKDFDAKETYLDTSLIYFKAALAQYAGEVSDIVKLDGENLICRCAKIDMNSFEVTFIKEQGHKPSLLKSTNASMICGSCKNQVEKYLDVMSEKHELFGGKSFNVWNDLIANSLEQFAFYSPQEFQGATIVVSKILMPVIEVAIEIPHESLKVDFAEKSLMNFLSKELKQGVDVKVTIDSSLSN